jgi:hypothetical protein
MSGFSIRDATPEDLPGIAELYFRVEADRSLDEAGYSRWWHWLHRQNPSGPGKTLVAVDDTGRVIGHYAIVPFEFRGFKAGFLCQLMVAEEFRTQLVFPRLELQILKDYRPCGMDFAYGLINRPLVLKAHFAFGFKRLMEFPVLARPVRFLGLLRPIKPSHLEVRELPAFDAAWEEFLSRASSAFAIVATRTSKILNWRFTQYPERGYRIFAAIQNGRPRGYAVVRRMNMKRYDVLALVDMLFEGEAGRALLRAVLDEAGRAGAQLCACMAPPASPLAGLLKRNLFVKTPEAFTLIVHQPKDSPLDLRGPWHLTWFDHDFV